MSWFPRLSPDGQSVVTQDSSKSRYAPVWVDNFRFAAKKGNGPGVLINDASAGFDDWPEPHGLCGGGGVFAAEYGPDIRVSDGREFHLGFHAALADDGFLVFLVGHNQPIQTLTDASGHTYLTGALEYPSASLTGVAVSRYSGLTPQHKETWYAPRGGAASRVHASGEMIEFTPVVVWTPEDVWIVTHTGIDVRLYPIGSTLGYRIPATNTQHVHAKWNGQGIRVVWNDAGQMGDRVMNIQAPREELIPDGAPPIDPPPPPPPPPPPEPSMLFDTLVRLRAKYPKFTRDADGKIRNEAGAVVSRGLSEAQLGALLNEPAFIHRGEGILLYPKSGGSVAIQPRTDKTISSDILLRQEPNGTLWWSDVLRDAEGEAEPKEPHWQLSDQPDTFLAPVPPDGVVDPPPPPPPPDDGRDDQQDAAIVALRRDLAELHGRHEALLARVDALPTSSGDALEKVKAVEAILARVIERLRKPFSTGRAFSHAHTATIIPPGEAL